MESPTNLYEQIPQAIPLSESAQSKRSSSVKLVSSRRPDSLQPLSIHRLTLGIFILVFDVALVERVMRPVSSFELAGERKERRELVAVELM
jgi:hypothetical protein